MYSACGGYKTINRIPLPLERFPYPVTVDPIKALCLQNQRLDSLPHRLKSTKLQNKTQMTLSNESTELQNKTKMTLNNDELRF